MRGENLGAKRKWIYCRCKYNQSFLTELLIFIETASCQTKNTLNDLWNNYIQISAFADASLDELRGTYLYERLLLGVNFDM